MRPRATALLLALAACDPGSGAGVPDLAGGSTGGDADPALEVSAVEHVLAWDLDGAVIDDDGTVQITNDLGIPFTLEQAFLVTHSVSLVQCPETMAWLPAPTELLVPEAHAADGGTVDSTALSVPHVEDVTAATTIRLEVLTFEAATYCDAHYLVARGVPDATNLPGSVDMVGTSLWLRGSHPDAAGLRHELVVETNLADGVSVPLTEVTNAARETGSIRLITTRSLGHLLDGVDPEMDGDVDMARAVLTNLTDHTRVQIEAADE